MSDSSALDASAGSVVKGRALSSKYCKPTLACTTLK